MGKQSAGILLYRISDQQCEVFLVHMGGPFWINKDDGAWSIPKGEFTGEEDPLAAAKREFMEETGFEIDGNFIPLKTVRQSGGKIVYSWAVEGDCDASAVTSNTFEIEWPPKSGRKEIFPEIDRAGWFSVSEARVKILKGQQPLIDEVETIVQSTS